MDKKFYYKTPTLVAMTLAGSTLVTHQVNAAENANNDNTNIIDQHDNASQIQNKQKELKSQSLNVSGTKEYKDPSIIEDPNLNKENTVTDNTQATDSSQPVADDNTQDTTATDEQSNVDDSTQASTDTTQPVADDNTQDTTATDEQSNVDDSTQASTDTTQPVAGDNTQDTTATDEQSNVDDSTQASTDSTQPVADENTQDTTATDEQSNVDDSTQASTDTTQPVADDNTQDTTATDEQSNVDDSTQASTDTTQPVADDNTQDTTATDEQSNVDDSTQASTDSSQPVADENTQDTTATDEQSNVDDSTQASTDSSQPVADDNTQDTTATDEQSNVDDSTQASTDSSQPVADENTQDTTATDEQSNVDDSTQASTDTTQPVADENTQDTTATDEQSNVDDSTQASTDTTQPVAGDNTQDTTATDEQSNVDDSTDASAETDTYSTDYDDSDEIAEDDNQSVQLETADIQPRSFALRSASYAPTAKKTAVSSYAPSVSSTINNQIRTNNYTVPTYVEDFSSHIPKMPYRNGVGKPEGIIAHETANPNSTIQGEVAYMKNNYQSAFVHAFVDDNNIIEVAPTDYLAWGAGGVANERFMHVELVRVYGSDRFAKSINNYADYLATNLAYYGLPLDSAENDGVGTLWSHDAVSRYLGGTNHSDPYGWFAENNYTFNELVDLVREKYLYKTGNLSAPAVSKPKPTAPTVTKPKPTKPVVSKLKPTAPTVAKPKPTKPVVSKPKPTAPTVAKPKPTTPVASKPVTSVPKTVAVKYKGTVKPTVSGVYTSVYDQTAKSGANKAGKTFNIGKQSTFNNQIYYLLQDNNGTPLGWVKSTDVQMQATPTKVTKPVAKPTASSSVKPKPVAKPTASSSVKPKPVAKPTASSSVKPKPVAKPAASSSVKPKPVVKPAASSSVKPKPVVKPTASSSVKPKPVVKPTASSSVKPAKTTRVNYVGKVSKNISGVYTSVYDQKVVPAINKAGKTFKIGKQSVYNNQTYYLLQDNQGIPLGWVKSSDIQVQTAQPKVVNQTTKVTPKKTNAIKSSSINNKAIALKDKYTNYLIFDNTGYFYSEPNVSKKTLLGSLQNYQYAYFKVISSQKIGDITWYKGLLNGKTVWISEKYLQLAQESTNISTSPYTLDQAVDKQMALTNGSEPKKVLSTGVRKATRAEVKDTMDTSKYVNDPVQKYQFLDLNKSQDIPASKLNDLLRGKGILENQGDAFRQAAKSVGVNEIYLISHALLETGNGTSQLANGGSIDKDGNVDLDSKEKYYNMFGVGAIDKQALYGGIKYAQQAGWNTPEKAILGGAQFIANNYIKSGQNTLYKMRWNPQSPGTHQYATGIDFAKSNAKRISDFYQQIQTDGQYYDVDQYKG
ncbi:glucosaminidase domain-containing protein [Mammaliicoccus sp. Dog046]|uniref:glucosaminidase domain-containing protein n=1 Tax=Mammaliicoccus sp. Dog046 TaxID=3034233 RepID=UPI002B26046F|nr:glucosaminidase domain-containing protein [Mammaliicoccus sp. Dog046]WQK84778.1 glucosaminidase domain-containing protein [Mammaliicoccus sp. Dog046]